MAVVTNPLPRMSLRDVWLHLRVPFSLYLLPIFLFAVTNTAAPDWGQVLAVALIIHLLAYPAANTFNSFYDRDEDAINGLEAPPPVTATLFWVALGLQGAALALGALVNVQFVTFLVIYGLVMMAYSYDGIRLKKYPVISWLVISVLQGGITYAFSYITLGNLPFSTLLAPQTLLGAFIATCNILAVYPLTQVYQHEEDARRGDLTISRLFGVRGTFLNAIFWLGASALGFFVFYEGRWPFWLMLACLLPGLIHFVSWARRVWQNPAAANFRSAHRMTQLTGVGMDSFFALLMILTRS